MDIVYLCLSLICVLLLFVFIVLVILSIWVFRQDCGTEEMIEVANAIRKGSYGFIRTQYLAIAGVSIPVGIALFVLYCVRTESSEDLDINKVAHAAIVMISFFVGAFFAGTCSVVVLLIAVRTNVRVSSAARRSYPLSLLIALRGGVVSSVIVVCGSFIGLILLYTILYIVFSETGRETWQVPLFLVGYAFGASFVALFAQLGGGIFTKAADMGADITSKIEHGIPEDDSRNPATIADLVGDCVGDCAGRGADLFESLCAEQVGVMILGGTLSRLATPKISHPARFVCFPLVVHALGIIGSLIGVLFVRVRLLKRNKLGTALGTNIHSPDDTIFELPAYEDPMDVFKRSYFIAFVVSAAAIVSVSFWLLYSSTAPHAAFNFAICGLIGVSLTFIFVVVSIYYTDTSFGPVKSIALASESGASFNVTRGLSVGLESTAIPSVAICISILGAYWLGRFSGLEDRWGNSIAGLFGTGVSVVGALAISCFILAVDMYGPVVDNAGGIVEMCGEPHNVRSITDALDAVGNSTKSLCKGYAVGSAALAVFLLFSAFTDEVCSYTGEDYRAVDLSQPELFVGGLVGATLITLFSSLSIKAVGSTALCVVEEVRFQFKQRPGIIDHTEKPDYARCVRIITQKALRKMIAPGLLVVSVPLCLGFTFRFLGSVVGNDKLGVGVVASMLMIASISGILLALFFNTTGAALDNAKKLIESGCYGGKGSDSRAAAVVGEYVFCFCRVFFAKFVLSAENSVVGDPLKDTTGPSLHIVIKLLASLSLVFAPIFIHS